MNNCMCLDGLGIAQTHSSGLHCMYLIHQYIQSRGKPYLVEFTYRWITQIANKHHVAGAPRVPCRLYLSEHMTISYMFRGSMLLFYSQFNLPSRARIPKGDDVLSFAHSQLMLLFAFHIIHSRARIENFCVYVYARIDCRRQRYRGNFENGFWNIHQPTRDTAVTNPVVAFNTRARWLNKRQQDMCI